MTEYSQKIRVNRVAEPKIRIKVKPRVPPLDPEFRNTGTYIEVRVGASGEWETLVPLADITGPDGEDGQIVEIVAGAGINVDNTNPANPVVTVDAVAAEIPFTPAATLAASDTQAAIAELEGKLGPMFATLALAEAYSPAAGPDYIRTAGYTAAGDGGGALHKKVVSEPSHGGKLSISLSGGGTVWYEIAEGYDCRAYGAKCDGSTNDSAAVLRQYGHLGKIILPADTTTVLSSWTTQNVAAAVSVEGGEGATISGLSATLFTLATGGAVAVTGVTFTSPAAAILDTAVGAVLGAISWRQSGITGGPGIFPVDDQCGSVTHLIVEDCRFTSLTADLVSLRADIGRADIHRNVVTGISRTGTNSCNAFQLGNTQLADQPDTGHYFCTDNLITGLTADGTGAGEIHAFLLYGTFAEVRGNTIKNLTRPNGSASVGTEGIEGIYTKVKYATITNNKLEAAGEYGNGNKGAAISHKGVALASVSATDPLGPYYVIANNTIIGSASIASSGIRTEGDYGSITGNVISLCYYGINVAPGVSASDLTVCDNVISLTTGPAAIRINAFGDGIRVADNLIGPPNGSVFTASENGILFVSDSRSGTMNRLAIVGNSINGAFAYGVRSYFTGSVTATNLLVGWNHIIGAVYGLRQYSDANITDGYVVGNMMDVTQAFRDQSTTLVYDGNFNAGVPVSPPEYQVVATNADFTLTAFVSGQNVLHTGTLTADRAVTLSTTNARAGRTKYRIARSGAGAFNLNVGTGPLKALASGQWCDVVYNGSAFVLTGYGSL